MSYTVGLDFGTHQTKVCIENASNPAHKIYEFFEFDMLDGNKTVFLPSIVQINKDDTLSYGFVDESQCKTMPNAKTEKPVLELPEKIELINPPEPVTIQKPLKPRKDNLRGLPMRDQLLYQQNYSECIEKWEEECKKIEEINNKNFEDWDLDCNAIKIDYDFDLGEYNKEVERLNEEYKIKLAQCEADNLPQKQIFRYFKLATFSSQFWKYTIKPEIISVWYLTFVLFKLQEKFGNEFYTQMGIPFSINPAEAENQKKIAYKILIAANILISEYKTLDSFLNTKYTELLQNTVFFDYNENDLSNYGLNVLPEAFAGLSSLTQQRRLERGMHLLVDIGGGTSDIAFFTITKNALPDIHAVVSFPLGLNSIFEEYIKNNPISLSEAQQKFRDNQNEFNDSISRYHEQLKEKTNAVLERVENEFINRQPIHNIHMYALRTALENKPVVYCGGGSTYDCMRISLRNFTDIRLITKKLLNIPYIENENIDDSMFTILATSYGLSIQMENEIEITPIENVFDHLPRVEQENRTDYEHTITDT